MAIKANFTAGLLSVTGDNGDDAITVTRDAAGQIVINGTAKRYPFREAHRRSSTPAKSMCLAGTATTRSRSTP